MKPNDQLIQTQKEITLRYDPEHTYTLDDFIPSLQELSQYFSLEEAFKQYCAEVNSRLDILYGGYAHYTYDEGAPVIGAGVEVRVFQIIETKERMAKVQKKVQEKKELLEKCLNHFSESEEAAILSYFNAGIHLASKIELTELTRRLQLIIGQQLLIEYEHYQENEGQYIFFDPRANIRSKRTYGRFSRRGGGNNVNLHSETWL